MEPPSYPPEPSGVAPPPNYHSRPSANENTLISGAIPPPEGIFSQSTKYCIIALTRQHDSASEQGSASRRPVYGRGSPIAGVVDLQTEHGLKLDDVLSVRIQITGKIKLDIAEGGTSSLRFLDHCIRLHPTSDASNSTCPSLLAFSYTLPTAYTEPQSDGAEPIERALPPTYQVAYDGVPGLRAEVKYSLKVKVERKRVWKLTQTHSLSIPFDYIPRTRPPLPGPEPTASFVASVKQAPEDWTMFVNDVPRREQPTTNRPVQYAMDTNLENGETISSSLILPSTQTFPLRQAIPFHLQLTLSSTPSTPRSQSVVTNQPRNSSQPPRRPQTAPSKMLPVPPMSRSATSPSPSGSTTLLSLFSNPTFGPPPRTRWRANTALVGVGEGLGFDGAMVFGDPRHGNVGRAGSVTGDRRSASVASVYGGAALREQAVVEDEVLSRAMGRGRGMLSSSIVPPARPVTAAAATARRTTVSSNNFRESTTRRPATSAGVPQQREPSPLPPPNVKKDENVSYIRVFLQRQIVVTVKGQKVVKTIACGDGRLHRITLDEPPTFVELHREQERSNNQVDSAPEQPRLSRRRTRSLSPSARPSREGLDYIAWEGYVLPSADLMTVGGFRATGLWVKDFITLTMVPPNPEQSVLRALHHAVPVRLVSDPWEQEWWSERRL